MAASMLMRLQREAHLPSLVFKDESHFAEGLFLGGREEITSIVSLVSRFLEVCDTEPPSSATQGLQLSVHLQ